MFAELRRLSKMFLAIEDEFCCGFSFRDSSPVCKSSSSCGNCLVSLIGIGVVKLPLPMPLFLVCE